MHPSQVTEICTKIAAVLDARGEWHEPQSRRQARMQSYAAPAIVLIRHQISSEIERVEIWLRGVDPAKTIKPFIAQRMIGSGDCWALHFRAGSWQTALAEIAAEVAQERAAMAALRRRKRVVA